MMTESIYEHDFPSLQNEFIICRKKLESKKEALKILVKQLEQAQMERDVYKNKVSQLQTENDGLKDVVGSFIHKSDKCDQLFLDESNDKKIKTLTSLLQFSREENQHLQTDIGSIKVLYGETQKDNQLLRMSLSKYESQRKADITSKQGKEQLVIQLEELDSKVEYLQEEIKALHDQNKELEEERNTFYDKNTRLNTELNYILHNDDKRVVDIDAIVLENQYLKEVIKQYKEEKTMALGTAARYKEALKQRNSKPSANVSKPNVASYLDPISPKKSSEGFFSKASNMTVIDLQRVNKALTERLTEKETALKHQRNTNRVLGMRVSELEKKLKTLEISGLWSHEQRSPRYDEDGVCSPPLSPDTPILVAERLSSQSESKGLVRYFNEPKPEWQNENHADKNKENSYENTNGINHTSINDEIGKDILESMQNIEVSEKNDCNGSCLMTDKEGLDPCDDKKDIKTVQDDSKLLNSEGANVNTELNIEKQSDFLTETQQNNCEKMETGKEFVQGNDCNHDSVVDTQVNENIVGTLVDDSEVNEQRTTVEYNKVHNFDDQHTTVEDNKVDNYDDQHTTVEDNKVDNFDDQHTTVEDNKVDNFDDQRTTVEDNKVDSYDDQHTTVEDNKVDNFNEQRTTVEDNKVDNFDDQHITVEDNKVDNFNENDLENNNVQSKVADTNIVESDAVISDE